MTDQLERLKTALSSRYAIENEIGSGGMATVYLAEDLKHHRKVAIKVLRPELAAIVGGERFLKEIEVTANLQHPHILPLFDSGEADGFLYYVMPFVEGESLRQRLNRERQLTIDDAVQITAQVAAALDYAHGRGIIHRDMKPENVLLEAGQAVVADFGIALAVTAAGGARLTETGLSLGTPHYMSPEQATAERQLDARSDIYSLAAVLYETLAGEPPHTGATSQSVIAKLLTEEPMPLHLVRNTVPEHIDDAVMKALAKVPADRHATAEKLVDELHRTPTGTNAMVSSGTEAAIRQMHPARTAGLFALSTIGAFALVYGLVMRLGLPYWVLYSAVGLLGVGLPLMLVTGHHERRRLFERAAGNTASPSGELGISRWLTWKSGKIAAALGFGVLVAVTSAFMGMRSLGIGPAGTLISRGVLDVRERVVLADFRDRTGDSVLAIAVTDLIRVDLGQSPAVRLLQPGELNAALARMELPAGTRLSLQLAHNVAEREGVKAVVAGEINIVGGRHVISAHVTTSATGETLMPLRETARDSTEIIDAVDRLSKRLRERIGESLRSVRATPPLSRARTSSLPALRKQTQATEAARMFDRRRAVALLREAVAIDTMFGYAYGALAIQLWNQNTERSAQVAAMSAARRLRDRLPETERLFLDQVYYTAFDYQPRRVIDVAQRHLTLDSTNSSTLSYLAWAHRRLRNFEQTERYYRWAIELDSTAGNEHHYLIPTILELGRINDADNALADFERVLPRHAGVAYDRAVIAAARGDYDSAEASLVELRRAQPENVNVLTGTGQRLAQLAVLRGQLEKGARYKDDRTEALRDGGGVAGLGVLRAAEEVATDVWLRGRDPVLVVAEVDAALARESLDDIDPLERPYLEPAVAYALVGEIRKARDLLGAFDSTVPLELRRLEQQNQYHRVLGLIGLVEGRPSDAVLEFRAADRGTCTTCILPDLARAYDLGDQADSAIAVYERYLAGTLRWFHVDAVAKALAHRRLGELYEARGTTNRAILHYNAFVELWKDADAELQPQVEDVKRRLVALVGDAR